jgi:hypothetical protein
MSATDDDQDEMQPSSLIDDATAEALITATTSGRDDALVRLLDEIRAVGDADAPAPSAELAAIFAGTAAGSGDRADVVSIGAATRRRRRRGALRAIGGLGLATKIALGAGAAAAAVGSAHAGGVLPAPVEHVVDDIVDVVDPRPHPVTPPEQTPAGAGRSATEPPAGDSPGARGETSHGQDQVPPEARSRGADESGTAPDPPVDESPGKPGATPGSPPEGAGEPPPQSNAGGNGPGGGGAPPGGNGNPGSNGPSTGNGNAGSGGAPSSSNSNAGGSNAAGAAANGTENANGNGGNGNDANSNAGGNGNGNGNGKSK